MVYILIGTGFEEIEALSACDILRRGGVEVKLAGVGNRRIRGGHGIEVFTDITVDDIDPQKAKMIVIPGGMGGVESIESSAKCSEVIKAAHKAGAVLAAICAGPRVLAKLSLLEGKDVTCYPGLESQISGAKADSSRAFVTDGKIVTGRAPGASLDFALELLRVLKGSETAERIREDICHA
ncbi:MAG TPA: DJ-1/PfpI family protein [Clostridiales bacterium]|jgi:4-methyl-5(b-hydroxyethyl)-thiazole monophosphate biosynthesis|nr:DJ-1/PfpI family protein [Clostridiales bacterium]